MIGDEDLADIRKKLWEAGSDTRLRHPKPGATQLFVSPRRYRYTTNSCAEAHPWGPPPPPPPPRGARGGAGCPAPTVV